MEGFRDIRFTDRSLASIPITQDYENEYFHHDL